MPAAPSARTTTTEQAPLKKSPWQKMAKRIATVRAKHSLLDDRVVSLLDLIDRSSTLEEIDAIPA